MARCSSAIARCEPASCRLHAGQRVQRVRVTREDVERSSVRALGRGQPADRPVDLAELHPRPGLRFALAGAGVDRELHRLDRSRHVTEQLARVGDAGVGREARAKLREPVEGAEGCGIAAELDQGVADHAVVAGGGRRDRAGTAAEHQRLAESVPRERQRAEAARRQKIVRMEGERVPEHAFGLACSRPRRRSRAHAAGTRVRADRASSRSAATPGAQTAALRSGSRCSRRKTRSGATGRPARGPRPGRGSRPLQACGGCLRGAGPRRSEPPRSPPLQASVWSREPPLSGPGTCESAGPGARCDYGTS